MFESVLNVGSIEILPQLRPLAEALGLESGRRFASGVQLLRRSGSILKALRGVSIRRLLQQAAHRNDLALSVAVQQAESRGNITTTSADPNVQPRIDYNYLSTPSDLARMREGVRTAVAILRSRAFKPLFKELTELSPKTLADDEALNVWLRTHLGTAIHACGSCAMGPAEDKDAVVDQFGRVHGVTGVRVADTSILPFAPSRGPAATAIMIGERMAEFLSSDLGQK